MTDETFDGTHKLRPEIADTPGREGWPRGRLRGPQTEEHRAKLSEAKRGNQHTLGYKHTPEARRAMSVARRGRRNTPPNLCANVRRLHCTDHGVIANAGAMSMHRKAHHGTCTIIEVPADHLIS